MLSVLICFVQIIYAINTKTPAPKNDRVTLIKNTVEQVDYLLEYNKSKSADHKKSDQWYIYIAGESLDSLKYYMNESTIIGFTDKYLKKLNDSLIQDIYSSFNVDEVIGDAIRDYASISGIENLTVFEENILEIATDTDIIIKSLSSNIKKQGANISLDVTIKGIDKPVRIQATLLEK